MRQKKHKTLANNKGEIGKHEMSEAKEAKMTIAN